jgi:hypothetical protein
MEKKATRRPLSYYGQYFVGIQDLYTHKERDIVNEMKIFSYT